MSNTNRALSTSTVMLFAYVSLMFKKKKRNKNYPLDYKDAVDEKTYNFH